MLYLIQVSLVESELPILPEHTSVLWRLCTSSYNNHDYGCNVYILSYWKQIYKYNFVDMSQYIIPNCDAILLWDYKYHRLCYKDVYRKWNMVRPYYHIIFNQGLRFKTVYICQYIFSCSVLVSSVDIEPSSRLINSI
jgi:hypothetical protein